jgi:hypothetical protein
VTASTISGWLLFATLWLVLLWSFASLVSQVNDKYSGTTDPVTGDPVKVPAWIWFIVIMQLIYYGLFGYVQARHIQGRLKAAKQGQQYSYLTTERQYILLSYWAKLSLASGIGYGLVFRTKDCPSLL